MNPLKKDKIYSLIKDVMLHSEYNFENIKNKNCK